jgi:hypothetical protein
MWKIFEQKQKMPPFLKGEVAKPRGILFNNQTPNNPIANKKTTQI